MADRFDRFQPIMNRSFSLRAFNQFETEINRHFWSFKAISDYSRFIAQAEKRKDVSKKTADVFKASGPDAIRIPLTVSDWLEARKELENWLRLGALVSASSYLEVYLSQIARSALMSDPLCRYGATKRLDGVVLLKAGKELPYSEEVEEITRGEWNSRLAAFKRVFGSAPVGLDVHISALEQIRKIRNEFAHGFGRELSVAMPSDFSVKPIRSLSQKTFVKYIGTISKSAAVVDRFLLAGFIGNFEIVHYYHQWRMRGRDKKDAKYDSARAFQRSLQRDGAYSANAEFCRQLIRYYDSL
ncbi:MAG: hypothetical protein QOH67_4756 [Hyphomicrobiales bacterium]|jgi:hypothetical protein|nr:hypothetical protein [Hyphomicrobiales bacterium]